MTISWGARTTLKHVKQEREIARQTFRCDIHSQIVHGWPTPDGFPPLMIERILDSQRYELKYTVLLNDGTSIRCPISHLQDIHQIVSTAYVSTIRGSVRQRMRRTLQHSRQRRSSKHFGSSGDPCLLSSERWSYPSRSESPIFCHSNCPENSTSTPNPREQWIRDLLKSPQRGSLKPSGPSDVGWPLEYPDRCH